MEIVVGKYTLESLTTGMYKDPFILYREYIQNSTDSIDEAINNKILTKGNEQIKIVINREQREITIEDNGTGIETDEAYKVLTDIGNSKKKYTTHKGFRGIGRLGGLSYCEKLEFETSCVNEKVKTIVEFDSDHLKELLIPGKYEDYTMVDVIKEISEKKIEQEDKEKHYFKVKLKGVSDKFKLLDIDKVENYLCQVAPVEFNGKFRLRDKINNMLQELKLENNEYKIFLGTSETEMFPIIKPYKMKFYADISKKIEDTLSNVKFKVIRNDHLNKIIAVVWYGESNLLGTIVDEKVKGLRVRKEGILIGDRFLLNDVFKEERFNGWVQGEVFVFDDKIIPNARRDDFERNKEYLYLIEELRKVGEQISYEIREASKLRNQKNSGIEQIAVDDIKSIHNNEKFTLTISEKSENIDDEFENLFNEFERENSEKNILKKIEEILREELDEEKVKKMLKRIEKFF